MKAISFEAEHAVWWHIYIYTHINTHILIFVYSCFIWVRRFKSLIWINVCLFDIHIIYIYIYIICIYLFIHIGLTENTFKDRFYKRKNSFKYKSKRNAVELSNFVWKKKNTPTLKRVLCEMYETKLGCINQKEKGVRCV